MSDLAWGLQMTVLGMGLVFGLLALLWGLLALVQRLDRAPAAAAEAGEDDAAAPDALPAAAAATLAVTAGEAADGTGGAATAPAAAPVQVDGIDADVIAAIVAATVAHRALLRRQAAPGARIAWPGSLLYASRWVGTGRARQNHSWQRRAR